MANCTLLHAVQRWRLRLEKPTSPDYTIKKTNGETLMVRSLKTTCLQEGSTTRQWHELVSASQAKVEKIQRRIYRESQKGDIRKVHSLQKLLSNPVKGSEISDYMRSYSLSRMR